MTGFQGRNEPVDPYGSGQEQRGRDERFARDDRDGRDGRDDRDDRDDRDGRDGRYDRDDRSERDRRRGDGQRDDRVRSDRNQRGGGGRIREGEVRNPYGRRGKPGKANAKVSTNMFETLCVMLNTKFELTVQGKIEKKRGREWLATAVFTAMMKDPKLLMQALSTRHGPLPQALAATISEGAHDDGIDLEKLMEEYDGIESYLANYGDSPDDDADGDGRDRLDKRSRNDRDREDPDVTDPLDLAHDQLEPPPNFTARVWRE